MPKEIKKHLFVKHVVDSKDYTRPRSSYLPKELPIRDREQHGNSLLSELQQIWQNFDNNRDNLSIINNSSIRQGEYIIFKGAVDQTLETGSLSSNGGVLLKLKTCNNIQEASVFIPESKRMSLLKKLSQYLTEETKTGSPKHKPLVDKIESINRASLQDVWNSQLELLPTEEAVWCELWFALDQDNFTDDILEYIFKLCEFYNIEYSKERLFFPERTVITVRANGLQLNSFFNSCDNIAEIRRAEELNSFWTKDLSTRDREEYINNLRDRIDYTHSTNVVTILDSGVNNDHLLIRDFLHDDDKLTTDTNWGIADAGHAGHGTAMAGLILYPNLRTLLESNERFSLSHRIESVKILPPQEVIPENQWHYVTMDAVNRAFINNPTYQRTYCMAVTGVNQNDFGKPSTWSATVDDIISGSEDGDPKLFVISAGNVREEADWLNYPESNLNLSVESPAQAWNTLTIGAYTEKVSDTVNTVAQKFELSPFSTTSASWESNWPIKPEVVFEGGNAIKRENTIDLDQELELLTLSHIAGMNKLKSFNATSAATALASNFLARLKSHYPQAWNETIRGLLIHSAEWKQEMIEQFNIDISKVKSKQELLRRIGYGIPNFDKAAGCKNSYLTLIAENKLKPYKLEAGTVKTNEIHYYELPWPKDVLESLEDAQVKLKVTLSYFIEPNPGDRGYSTTYAYQSTALEFKVIKPTEDFGDFKKRINEKERGENDKVLSSQDSRWFFGSNFKGSIHSNFIQGTAVEIAQCNKIAVYPKASGWWKNLKKKEKYNNYIRYSLIVSIETPETKMDIYTPVATAVKMNNIVNDQVISRIF